MLQFIKYSQEHQFIMRIMNIQIIILRSNIARKYVYFFALIYI